MMQAQCPASRSAALNQLDARVRSGSKAEFDKYFTSGKRKEFVCSSLKLGARRRVFVACSPFAFRRSCNLCDQQTLFDAAQTRASWSPLAANAFLAVALMKSSLLTELQCSASLVHVSMRVNPDTQYFAWGLADALFNFQVLASTRSLKTRETKHSDLNDRTLRALQPVRCPGEAKFQRALPTT